MRKELDEFLVKSFPEIFVNRHADMRQTLMCWGFSCEDGWFDILHLTCTLIQSHVSHMKREHERFMKYQKAIDENDMANIPIFYTNNKKSNPDYTLTIPPAPVQPVAIQVKEKFGSLRFYINGADETIRAYLSVAECMSAKTCEICGNKGETRTNGWYRTLCDQHARENGYDVTIALGDEVKVLMSSGTAYGEIVKITTPEEVELKMESDVIITAFLVKTPVFEYWKLKE